MQQYAARAGWSSCPTHVTRIHDFLKIILEPKVGMWKMYFKINPSFSFSQTHPWTKSESCFGERKETYTFHTQIGPFWRATKSQIGRLCEPSTLINYPKQGSLL